MGQHIEGAPCCLEGAGRRGATGAQCSDGRLQEKSEGVLADGTIDEWAEGAMNDYLEHPHG